MKGWLLAQVGEVVVIEIARVFYPGGGNRSREEWSGGHADWFCVSANRCVGEWD